MQSESDQRIENNTVRHAYRILTEPEKSQVLKIKDDGLALIDFLDSLGNSRELSIAKTKVEEAVMWAVKHITS